MITLDIDPPEGLEETKEFRPPVPGEWYLGDDLAGHKCIILGSISRIILRKIYTDWPTNAFTPGTYFAFEYSRGWFATDKDPRWEDGTCHMARDDMYINLDRIQGFCLPPDQKLLYRAVPLEA